MLKSQGLNLVLEESQEDTAIVITKIWIAVVPDVEADVTIAETAFSLNFNIQNDSCIGV